jgi:hypothetical protein
MNKKIVLPTFLIKAYIKVIAESQSIHLQDHQELGQFRFDPIPNFQISIHPMTSSRDFCDSVNS